MFLKLATYTDVGRKRAKHDASGYAAIDKNLSQMLARASHDKEFTEKWLADFRKVGNKAYVWCNEKGWQPYEVKGYQALATSMQNAKGYSRRFLYGVADDILEVEKKHSERPWLDLGKRDDKPWLLKQESGDGIPSYPRRRPMWACRRRRCGIREIR